MEQRVALSSDAVFGLLVDRRRRFVLHYPWTEEDDVVQLDALIERVAGQLDEGAIRATRAGSSSRLSIEIDLTVEVTADGEITVEPAANDGWAPGAIDRSRPGRREVFKPVGRH